MAAAEVLLLQGFVMIQRYSDRLSEAGTLVSVNVASSAVGLDPTVMFANAPPNGFFCHW
jgi:hypothetical protein